MGWAGGTITMPNYLDDEVGWGDNIAWGAGGTINNAERACEQGFLHRRIQSGNLKPAQNSGCLLVITDLRSKSDYLGGRVGCRHPQKIFNRTHSDNN